MLFHPDLPGVTVADLPARRRGGWRGWDALSEDEQKAHRAAELVALRVAAELAGASAARLEALTDALSKTPAAVSTAAVSTDQAPISGDPEKE